jgi:UDP-N-acetylmuramoylalanine--D-glutamate ligase
VKNSVFLLGYGKTTKALAKLFEIDKIFDDREIEDEIAENSLNFPEVLEAGDILIPTPAIPPHHKIVSKFSENVMSEYDFIYEKGFFKFSIWISGTNGKTTTTEMITHLLKDRGAVSGGNIGTPLGELAKKESDLWVLETSSFTLHYTKIAKPNLYVLLPISEDHTVWHGDFKSYEESKLKPIKSLEEGEVAIIPEKYGEIETDGYLITYRDEVDLAQKIGIDISKVDFKGGFLLDAVLALSVSKILFDQIDYAKINSFQRSPHRQERIFDKRGRLWINDSKATNPNSTLSLLSSFSKSDRVLLILGGEDKGADWREMFQRFSELNIKLFAIGKSIPKSLELAKEFGIEISTSNDIYNAVADISKEHNLNTIAVLSPASASFDQFRSYEDRGTQFKELLKNT